MQRSCQSPWWIGPCIGAALSSGLTGAFFRHASDANNHSLVKWHRSSPLQSFYETMMSQDYDGAPGVCVWGCTGDKGRVSCIIQVCRNLHLAKVYSAVNYFVRPSFKIQQSYRGLYTNEPADRADNRDDKASWVVNEINLFCPMRLVIVGTSIGV